MTEIISILVVEDEDDMYQAYEDAAAEFSPTQFDIRLYRQISSDQIKQDLLSNNYDGAIVDLNLVQGDPTDASGNMVLTEILENHRFPVLVVSGNLQNLEGAIENKKSGFLKFYDRTTSNNDIFQYLLDVHSTGITRILGGRGQIEKKLGEIFWNHLAHEIADWNAEGSDSEQTLLRYAVAHLTEYLDTPFGNDKHYHRAEFYIKPPIRRHISTGDIVEQSGEKYIMLSPACDVALREEKDDGTIVINVTRVMVVSLFLVDRDDFISHGVIKSGDDGPKRKAALEKIIKGQREKYAFIPEYGDVKASVVDFQSLETWTIAEYQQAVRIATVTSPFLKDIQSRFAAYYGRQGQPDLNKEQLIKDYKSRLSPPT